jgi:hypothetical protein
VGHPCAVLNAALRLREDERVGCIKLLEEIYANVSLPEYYEKEIRTMLQQCKFVEIKGRWNVIKRTDRKNGVRTNDLLSWKELVNEDAVLMAFTNLRGVGTEYDVVEGEHPISTGGCLEAVEIRKI